VFPSHTSTLVAAAIQLEGDVVGAEGVQSTPGCGGAHGDAGAYTDQTNTSLHSLRWSQASGGTYIYRAQHSENSQQNEWRGDSGTRYSLRGYAVARAVRISQSVQLAG
jgi:hypothetical protein